MSLRPTLSLLLLAALAACALTLSACGGGSGDGTTDSGSLASFCADYIVVQDKTNALGNATGSSLQGRKTALTNFAKALQDLAADAPDEIQTDVQKTADWASNANDAVASAKSIAAFQQAGEKYGKEHPQPAAASTKSDKFASDNCGGKPSGSGK